MEFLRAVFWSEKRTKNISMVYSMLNAIMLGQVQVLSVSAIFPIKG